MDTKLHNVKYGMKLFIHSETSTVASKSATILVPNLDVKSTQLIWRSGTHRLNLRVPDPQVSFSDLT